MLPLSAYGSYRSLDFLVRAQRRANASLRRFILLMLLASLIAPGGVGPVQAMVLPVGTNPASELGAAGQGALTPTPTPSEELTLEPAETDTLAGEATATLEPIIAPRATETHTPELTATPTSTDTPVATNVPDPNTDSSDAMEIADLVPAGLPLIEATAPSVSETTAESVQVPASGAAALFLGGRVGVIAGAGAFAEPVTLVMQPQQVQMFSPPVISSTVALGLGAGPEQMPIRFTLNAYRVRDGAAVGTFNAPLLLAFDLRGIEGVAPGAAWVIAYRDERDETLWHRLGATTHDPAGLISASALHFSEWYAGPDPGAWHYRWNPPAASTFSGAATYRYPIELPPGRGGLTPNIDFSYSSRGVDGLVLSNQDQGPLGLGWSLNNIEISRNGTELYDDGAHVFVMHADNFQLVLNGASYDLQPNGSTSGSIVNYYAKDGPQLFIQRIYDPAATTANVDKFYWIVKTPDGTTYRLGYTLEAESGQSGFVTTVGHAGAQAGRSGIRWRVDTATDLYGNQIQYDYVTWTQTDNYTSNSGMASSVTTDMRRVSEIRYNFVALATNYNDRRPAGEARTKIVLMGSGDNKRLIQVKLYHLDLATPYRLIDISRDSVIHSDCGQSTTTDRILSIRQLNGAGTTALPATTFTYVAKPHAWGACYQYEYVEQVDNGYGGKVKFTYEWDGRIGDWGCGCVPAFGASWFVVKTEMWDGINPQPTATDYAYQAPCYDQIDGALGALPDAFSCPTHALIPGPFGNFPYEHGSLVGFSTTTVTYKDYGGAVTLAKSQTQFHQDINRMGRPFVERQLDPATSSVLTQVDTAYASVAIVPAITLSFTHASVVTNTLMASGGHKQTRTEFFYDPAAQGNAQYGNLTKKLEWGEVGVSGDERTSYWLFYPNASSNVWLVSLVARESIYAGNWPADDSTQTALAARTRYRYNDQCLSTPPTKITAISVERWLGGSGTTTCEPDPAWATVRSTYNTWGNQTSESQPYSGSVNPVYITASYDTTYRLYPISITLPTVGGVTQVLQYQYYGVNGVAANDQLPGLLKRTIDPNNQATLYVYDVFGRLTKLVRPLDSESQPTQSFDYSDWASPALSGPLTVGNAGFETGADWFCWACGGQTYTYDTTQKRSGSRSLKIVSTSSADHWVGNLNVTGWVPGAQYWVSAWVKTTSSGQLCLSVSGKDGHEAAASCISATSAWQEIRAVVSLPIDATRFLLILRTPYAGATNTIFVDDVQAAAGLTTPAPQALPLRVQTVLCEVTGQCGSNVRPLHEFYDGLGRLIQTRAETVNGSQQAVTNVVYDGLGRTTKSYVPVSASWSWWFNRPTGWDSQPKTTTQYDALGRVIQMTNTDNTTTRLGYLGWQTAALDANGHQRLSSVDALGRMTWVKEYSGVYGAPNFNATAYATTNYTYNIVDQLTSVTDAAGNLTTITYDKAGRKTNMTDPDMGYWQYAYDVAGNLTRQTDAKGQRVCFYYDVLNRLTGKHYRSDDNCPTSNPSLNVSYTYDSTAGGNLGKGRRTGMGTVGPDANSASWVYDARGRVINEGLTIAGVNYTTRWTYDALDRVKTMTYPDNEVLTYNYGANGLPTSLSTSLSGNYVASATYTVDGKPDLLTFGHDNLRVDYGYYAWTAANGAGRLQQIKSGTTANPTQLLNLTYTYDGGGNIDALNDAGSTADFTYDALDRLTQVSGAYAETYAYADAQGGKLGNLTSKTGVGNYTYGTQTADCPEGALPVKPHAVVTAGANTYCYDQNGNMRRRIVGAVTQTLIYDYENRLTGLSGTDGTTASFAYNAGGARVKSTINGTTIAYVGGHYEKNLTSGVVTKYYAFGGQRIAMRQGGELYYMFGDHLGSSSATWRVSNNAVLTQRYYAWGGVRSGGPLPTDYAFTGQKADAGLGGIMFYTARWYDPAIGRFLQADSIVPRPSNPQEFNRYGYTLNNPVRHVDSTGHFTEDELNQFFSGWENWSDLLKELMLNPYTTWGSVIFLGYGGDEPELILQVVLEQSEPNQNSFFGTFLGLGGPDKGEWYYESSMEKLNQYSNGSTFTDLGQGYVASYATFDSPNAQHSQRGWLEGMTLEDLVPRSGSYVDDGVVLGYYNYFQPVLSASISFKIKDRKLIPALSVKISINQESYPALLLARPSGAPGYYLTAPISYNNILPPRPLAH